MELGEYDHRAVEAAARELWESHDVYAYDSGGRGPVFSVDTPPPYVSAAHLHVGHAMSYSQPDFIVRYRRMRGERVFYPIGFDDNGLPTERYVEQAYGVRAADMPRAEFVALCLAKTAPRWPRRTWRTWSGPAGCVMDTWMTSSLTPQINDGWAVGGTDPALAPMSMRVQAFEIIRTWLFYSVVQSELHFGRMPWRTALISGWGLSEQGKKLSKRDLDKSTGADGYNRYVPDDVMAKYGADALRLVGHQGPASAPACGTTKRTSGRAVSSRSSCGTSAASCP